jgi:hypothetical protein
MKVDRSRIRKRAAGAVVLAVTATLVLSACGGSSPKKSTTTPVANSGSSSATGATGAGAFAARREALATCLKKYGVTLSGGGFGGGRFGGTGASGFRGRFGASGASGASGFRRRFGASGASGFHGFPGGFGASGASGASSKDAKAFAACGGLGGGRFGGGGGGFARAGGAFSASSATDRAEVTAFVACVRKNGFDLPNPNFASGAVFPAADQTNPKFIAASAKCASILKFSGTGST